MLLIGALTSKLYQFSARFWELDFVDSFDFFDSLGTSLYIEYNELKIKRIMPKKSINNCLNIISDRIRFYYDAYFLGYIEGYFLIKKKTKLIIKVSLYFIYKYIKYSRFVMLNQHATSLNYYYGQELDLFSLLSLKKLFYSYVYINFYSYNVSNFYLFIDYIDNYFLHSSFEFFNLYDIFILVMYNIRCEHPILYVYFRILQKYNKQFFFFGNNYFIDKKIKFFGLNIKDLLYFFYKKNLFKYKNRNFLWLIGSGFINRYDFFFYNLLFVRFQTVLIKYKILCTFKYIIFNLFELNQIYFGLIMSWVDRYIFFNKNINYMVIYNIFHQHISISNLSVYAINFVFGNYVVFHSRLVDFFLSSCSFYEQDLLNINIYMKKIFHSFLFKRFINTKVVSDFINFFFFFNIRKIRLNLFFYFIFFKNLRYFCLGFYIFLLKKPTYEFYFLNYEFQLFRSYFFCNELYCLKFNLILYNLYVLNNYYIFFPISVKSLNLTLAYNNIFRNKLFYYYLYI
jgi:hypothetical protein